MECPPPTYDYVISDHNLWTIKTQIFEAVLKFDVTMETDDPRGDLFLYLENNLSPGCLKKDKSSNASIFQYQQSWIFLQSPAILLNRMICQSIL